MEPAAKFAQRIVRGYRLVPPIDPAAILQELADIETVAALPANAAAVTIGLKAHGRRPKTIINIKQSSVRVRFTYAHELGHIRIPWHTGTIVSFEEGEYRLVDSPYREIVQEANYFAAELLVPSDWLTPIIAQSSTDGCAVIRAVSQEADVSEQVACIRVAEQTTEGFLAVRQGADGEVKYMARSPGTRADPRNGDSFRPEQFAAISSRYDHSANGLSGELHVFRFDSQIQVIPNREHRRRLPEIAAECGYSADEQRRILQAVAGVFGAANQDRPSPDALLSRALQRMSSDAKYAKLLGHPDLRASLAGRAQQIANRPR